MRTREQRWFLILPGSVEIDADKTTHKCGITDTISMQKAKDQASAGPLGRGQAGECVGWRPMRTPCSERGKFLLVLVSCQRSASAAALCGV